MDQILLQLDLPLALNLTSKLVEEQYYPAIYFYNIVNHYILRSPEMRCGNQN